MIAVRPAVAKDFRHGGVVTLDRETTVLGVPREVPQRAGENARFRDDAS